MVVVVVVVNVVVLNVVVVNVVHVVIVAVIVYGGSIDCPICPAYLNFGRLERAMPAGPASSIRPSVKGARLDRWKWRKL